MSDVPADAVMPDAPAGDGPSAATAPASVAAAAYPAPGAPRHVVREGDTVIVEVGDKTCFLVAKRKSRFKLGKHVVSLEPVIGEPYGARFEVAPDGQSIERVYPEAVPSASVAALPLLESAAAAAGAAGAALAAAGSAAAAGADGAAAAAAAPRDNRHLQDRSAAQALSHDAIQTMKLAGAAGGEIVAALAAHSTTFGSKTAFSQEKYLRKKERKHCPVMHVRRPTAAAVCDAYCASKPLRVWSLRSDILALLLVHANAAAHAELLVVDACGGLVAAAAAERLGGHGKVCVGVSGRTPPPADIVRLFNFGEAELDTLCWAPLEKLAAGREAARAGGLPPPADGAATGPGEGAPERAAAAAAPEGEAVPSTAAAAEGAAAEGSAGGPHKRKRDGEGGEGGGSGARVGPSGRVRPASDPLLGRWARLGFTGLLLAAPPLQPAAALRTLLPLLTPSAPFAVFCPWLQPLTEAFDVLHREGLALGMTLSETWQRGHQVLPSRTHPTMQMSGHGGYLLTGTRIQPDMR